MDKEKIIHAHWELAPEDTAYENVWVCSNCGEDFTQHRKPKFIDCPHCGAKMDEPDTGGKQQIVNNHYRTRGIEQTEGSVKE